ncbi:MAG TPA: serine hydrolase [Gemmatimonadales bacterium]|nr:serine hydrolase [Gemmatimonadales bacterium]
MIRSFVRGVALCTLPALLHAQDVARQLRKFVPGGDTVVAIAFIQPATGRHAFLGADLRLHAASTMKVPVLIELARRVDAGDLRWEDRLPVENRFASIADSADFSVDAADDSDSLPYTWIGSTATVADLARHMTVRSSNLATDILIQRLGADRVNATAHRLGADSVTVLRGVEDDAAYRRGMNNTLTARGLATLLTALLGGRAASAEGTQRVLALLAAQEFNGGIPGGVPAGTLVAHKTGWITGIAHDAAIVYPPNAPPYVLVILTRGYGSEADAEAVMRTVTAAVHRIATRR